MTANQLVALNLQKARAEMGWTQEKAAQLLWEYLGGKRWSKASFSVAERSADEGARTRNFDANELLAFSQVFDKPIGWFFLPPADDIDVVCGDPVDVQRVVAPVALRRAASGGALMRLPLRKLETALAELKQLAQREEQ